MTSLLNAVNFLGLTLNTGIGEIMLAFLIVELFGVLIEIFVIAVVISNRKRRAQQAQREVPKVQERKIKSISIEIGVVQKKFAVGEKFNCDGIVVLAHYDSEPYWENVTQFEVFAPDMTVAGEQKVKISYKGKSATYAISIGEISKKEQKKQVELLEAPVQPAALIEMSNDSNKTQINQEGLVDEEDDVAETWQNGVRYLHNKSFTAKLILSDDETKQWYTTIKNNLLSYKKVKDRMSWKCESFRFGRELVARVGYRGKTLCLYFPLNPADYADSKYKVEDVSGKAAYADTPCMFRIKNDRRAKYAMDLFATVMKKYDTTTLKREMVDYTVPKEDVEELLNRGLIKLVQADIKRK